MGVHRKSDMTERLSTFQQVEHSHLTGVHLCIYRLPSLINLPTEASLTLQVKTTIVFAFFINPQIAYCCGIKAKNLYSALWGPCDLVLGGFFLVSFHIPFPIHSPDPTLRPSSRLLGLLLFVFNKQAFLPPLIRCSLRLKLTHPCSSSPAHCHPCSQIASDVACPRRLYWFHLRLSRALPVTRSLNTSHQHDKGHLSLFVLSASPAKLQTPCEGREDNSIVHILIIRAHTGFGTWQQPHKSIIRVKGSNGHTGEKNKSSHSMTKYGRYFQTTLNTRKQSKKHAELCVPKCLRLTVHEKAAQPVMWKQCGPIRFQTFKSVYVCPSALFLHKCLLNVCFVMEIF